MLFMFKIFHHLVPGSSSYMFCSDIMMSCTLFNYPEKKGASILFDSKSFKSS